MDRSKAYEVLELPLNSGEDAIKEAYRNLARKYSVDRFEPGPERDAAAAKMDELNEAFDMLMSYLRTGGANAADPAPTAQGASSYPAIRHLINAGQVDEALTELSSIPAGASSAEWNFLMGSAYYYKGWLDQALHYFREAVRLEPGNREYEAALRNLQRSSEGNMEGNPYEGRGQDAAALNCACNTCAMMCCLDACCGVCRGF